MSLQFLKDALEDIKALIAITEQDISDIKVANNESIFARIPQKEELTSSFIRKKEAYAKSIEDRLRKEYPNATLADLTYEDKQKLLGEGASEFTAQLHDKLEELKKLNYRFGKMSLAVSEFYNSLLRNIIPIEQQGYKKSSLSNSSFLKTEV
ncbi:hypothetical protein [Helicobacter pullorum]|uniref:Flagellar protein FlgN n=1 Tax=Helicobacter pullorum TaxID=35818 RepID=A0A0N0LQI3_9HELI|nr:hypothetical protein [Helicobacter pullorum]HIS08328.1 hypothetical protein [Candidatus Scatomorpha intestinipullorum]KPH49734.1 hypothetical protein HPU229336_06585 [Helicobacter pullorum]KPH50928.1 hypothetical protein HPU229254_08475 [Helicobacter pullorum]KPH52178.1 hypothetical protein HPU229313_07130 [Helicobacter pullorum]KPH54796.1 hypothetical protein HPU229334_12025 [Helicobacter pullorum]